MKAWHRRVTISLLGVLMVASWWTSNLGQTSGREALPQAKHVLLFGFPYLDLSDVNAQLMPNLTRLAGTGGIGALRVKTVSVAPAVAEAYASLGAGSLMNTGANGSLALDRFASSNGMSALAGQRLSTGINVDGKVVVPGVPSMELRDDSTPSGVGGLGVALRQSGHRTAVVANASLRDDDGRIIPNAPAALAVTDADGMILGGTVSPKLLDHVPSAPFGLQADPRRFVSAVNEAFKRADVVAVDPGETTRAALYRSPQTAAVAARSRAQALARTDGLLGKLARNMPSHTMIMVVGVTPYTNAFAMSPLVLFGDGIPPGMLASPSTHRSGIVALTDLAPTILHELGVTVPDSMQGSALRIDPQHSDFAHLVALNHLLITRSVALPAMRMVFIVVQVFVYLGALYLLRRRRLGQEAKRWLEVLALSCAAWPLVTFLLRLSMATSSLGYFAIPVTWLVAFGIGVVTQSLRARVLDPLLAICSATFALIVVDLATGGHIILGSYFGSAPNVGLRYFGSDNAVFAILATCTIVVCGAIVDRSQTSRNERAVAGNNLWLIMTIALVAILVDGTPWIGADVGGVLTLVPVLGVMIWTLSGRQLKWRYVAIAVSAGLVCLAGAVGIDALRPADQRTHIGRFFLETASGDHTLLTTTIAEKWNSSMAALWQSVWTWAIPIVALYALYVLVVAKAWTGVLPLETPRRIVVVSALVLGIVGWLLNDSGILITALVFVYLGPMLILIEARDSSRGELQMIEEVV